MCISLLKHIMEPTLLGIPFEIRIKIYEELLIDSHLVGSKLPNHLVKSRNLGPRKDLKLGVTLLRVCKQIYAEARITLYKDNQFYFDQYSGCFNLIGRNRSFLQCGMDNGRHIQHVAIAVSSAPYCYYPSDFTSMMLPEDYAPDCPVRGDCVGRTIEFLSRGHKLKTLEIVFPNLYDPTVSDIWAHFFRNPVESRLMRIILKLKGVKFLCHDTIIDEWVKMGDTTPSGPLVKFKEPLHIMKHVAKTIREPVSTQDLETKLESREAGSQLNSDLCLDSRSPTRNAMLLERYANSAQSKSRDLEDLLSAHSRLQSRSRIRYHQSSSTGINPKNLRFIDEVDIKHSPFYTKLRTLIRQVDSDSDFDSDSDASADFDTLSEYVGFDIPLQLGESLSACWEERSPTTFTNPDIHSTTGFITFYQRFIEFVKNTIFGWKP